MEYAPILVIQTRRLGDLILSFPLFLRLRRLSPQNALWICAEPRFSSGLANLVPDARFLPPSALPWLARESYAAVINLSSTRQAALCAGLATSRAKTGMVARDDGIRAHGFWQLYRMALTQNNRHNLFHWSDLDCLDLYQDLPLDPVPREPPRPAGKGAVGIFVGASEPAKRPDAEFWGRLARRLAGGGYKPILFGGQAEIPLGREVAEKCGPGHINLCGKLSIAQLAASLKTLDLFISPDTGPMHLANWVGAPVLNLSLGNVQAAETGPTRPGQWVLRASMSCVGCWRCQRPRLYCKHALNPLGAAAAALAILAGKTRDLEAPVGLELLRTGSDELGLVSLEPLGAKRTSTARRALDQFWKKAFLAFRFQGRQDALAKAAGSLVESYPRLAAGLRDNLGKMLADFGRRARSGQILPEDFWRKQPPHSGLFAGHTQMALQNDGYSRRAWKTVMARAGLLRDLLAP